MSKDKKTKNSETPQNSEAKGTGKSGGFRIITYLLEYDDEKDCYEVNLITIYDKSEESSVNKAKLLKLIKNIIG